MTGNGHVGFGEKFNGLNSSVRFIYSTFELQQ